MSHTADEQQNFVSHSVAFVYSAESQITAKRTNKALQDHIKASFPKEFSMTDNE